MAESGTSSGTEPNRVIVNVVHQDHHSNSVTTVSGETRPTASNSSVSTPVQANHANGIRGNLLPVSSGIVTPILSQEGLSALLQLYISTQLCQVSRNSQPISVSARTSAAVTQPRFQQSSTSSSPGTQLTGVNNPLVTSHVKYSAATSRKVNFNVKVINPTKKKEFETYVLREVSKDRISTPTLLRKELIQQFGESLVSSAQDFAVGYYRGCCKLSICSPADIEEVWKCACKGENITLWCNGPKQTRIEIGSDSDEDVVPKQRKKQKRCALDEKNRRVKKLASSLREKHGDTFTKIQYRLWAEMVDVGTHKYV